jgi:hypothetical protein
MVLTTDDEREPWMALEESNDENHYEVFWLRDLVGEARAELEH